MDSPGANELVSGLVLTHKSKLCHAFAVEANKHTVTSIYLQIKLGFMKNSLIVMLDSGSHTYSEVLVL